MVKELRRTLEGPTNSNAQRLKHIFELVDDELSREPGHSLDKVNLNRSILVGLNSRRSEMEILAFILKIAIGGAKKTKILYHANLSGRQMKNFITFLESAGFLQKQNRSGRGSSYKTTPKGNLFLFHWVKILSLLESTPDGKTFF